MVSALPAGNPGSQRPLQKYKNKNVRVIGIAAESGTIDDVKHKLTEFRVGYRGDPPGPIQLTGILWTAQQI